jgi:hypothetical protein
MPTFLSCDLKTGNLGMLKKISAVSTQQRTNKTIKRQLQLLMPLKQNTDQKRQFKNALNSLHTKNPNIKMKRHTRVNMITIYKILKNKANLFVEEYTSKLINISK